ncbi:MAG TPA: hypothetical protein VK475_05080 [Pyrinomonadaceae bacterium]|nr:hypothetical protein [Pyrinomonadaceae bacterium]
MGVVLRHPFQNLTVAISSLALFAVLGQGFAQTPSAQSVSGQFISRDQRRGGPSDLAVSLGSDINFISLDPALLAISCERIKRHLERELGAGSPGRGKILLVLHSAQFRDETITITSEQFKDSWQYHVDLPDVTERARYVRAIVQVLLLEMANRTVPERLPELPLWLVEGFARQLLASSETEIILPPPDRALNGIALKLAYYDSRKEREREAPLERSRKILRSRQFLTFEQLSWPADDQLNGEEGETFCLSAQLFVTGLLGLKDGKAALRQMIADLPQFYNWQLDFLRAFHSYFERPLDVEKWWTLHWVAFTAAEATHTWPVAESWQKLEDSLHPNVELRAGTNEMPLHGEVTLQTIVNEWPAEKQTQVLQFKLREWERLRLQLNPYVASLLDEYRFLIESYVQAGSQSGFPIPFRKKSVTRHAKQQALAGLDLLDARRLALKPKAEPLAQSKVPPSVQ